MELQSYINFEDLVVLVPPVVYLILCIFSLFYFSFAQNVYFKSQ